MARYGVSFEETIQHTYTRIRGLLIYAPDGATDEELEILGRERAEKVGESYPGSMDGKEIIKRELYRIHQPEFFEQTDYEEDEDDHNE